MNNLIPICMTTLVLAGCAPSTGYRASAFPPPNATSDDAAPTHRYDPFFGDRHARSRYSYTVPRDGDAKWHRRSH